MIRSLSLGLIAVVVLSGCGKVADPWEGRGGPPHVIASFPPAASFARAIGGERVGLITLCTTTGPHDYQPSIRNAILLDKANLLLGNGLGLDDHFLDRMKDDRKYPHLVLCKLGTAIKSEQLLANPHLADPNHEHKADGSCCGHGPNDPHVWLDVENAIAMVELLRDKLGTIDEAGAAGYQQNAAKFVAELKQLHAEGKAALKGFKAPLITFHDSMGYFARSFGLKRLGSIQTNPGVAPDAKKLEKLIRDCEGQSQVVIAIEPQYPPSMADTLKNALQRAHQGLEVIVVTLDPLETCGSDEELNGQWYLNRMRKNFAELAKAVR